MLRTDSSDLREKVERGGSQRKLVESRNPAVESCDQMTPSTGKMEVDLRLGK